MFLIAPKLSLLFVQLQKNVLSYPVSMASEHFSFLLIFSNIIEWERLNERLKLMSHVQSSNGFSKSLLAFFLFFKPWFLWLLGNVITSSDSAPDITVPL